jgi:hypothetical protein
MPPGCGQGYRNKVTDHFQTIERDLAGSDRGRLGSKPSVKESHPASVLIRPCFAFLGLPFFGFDFLMTTTTHSTFDFCTQLNGSIALSEGIRMVNLHLI